MSEEEILNLQQKVEKIEVKQIEQNRNVVSVIKNIVDYGFDNENAGKRKSAWIALGGYFLRQRVFIILTSILTALISSASLYIAYNSNKLIEQQNILIKDEAYLIEAERRSSLNFILSEVINRISNDLSKNRDRTISKETISQIIAFSRSLKPYRYLEYGELIESEISPERGQLLTFIMNSGINEISLNEIYKNSDFSYADLNSQNLMNKSLENIHLDYAKFNLAQLNNTSFKGGTLNNSDFSKAVFVNEVDFSNTSLCNVNFDSIIVFEQFPPKFIFDNALVDSSDFFNKMANKPSNLNALKNEYNIVQEDKSNYRIKRKN